MALVSHLPRRDFFAIVLSLSGVTVLAWGYLIWMAEAMSSPEYLNMAALAIQEWTSGYFWMMFSIWAVMMVGMMVPSAAPMILIFAAVARKAKKQGTPIASTAAFTSGYIFMWAIFSFFATFLQWEMDQAALLSPLMVSNSPKLGAGLLMAAGIYQWMPLKDSCLKHCRSPFHFISEHWRPGNFGALLMGISHGASCIGCCCVLMLLLFVGGVMNILWIGIITIFVLLEKVLPLGDRGGKLTGALMVMLGGFLLFN